MSQPIEHNHSVSEIFRSDKDRFIIYFMDDGMVNIAFMDQAQMVQLEDVGLFAELYQIISLAMDSLVQGDDNDDIPF